MSTAAQVMSAAFFRHDSPMNSVEAAGRTAEVLVDGDTMGSPSMTAYAV